MTPEQHEQQRRWVAASLLAEGRREDHHDTYPRRPPAVTPDERPSIEVDSGDG